MTDYESRTLHPLVIVVTGSIDNVSSSAFVDDMVAAASGTNAPTLILDMTEVDFINSLGIGGLIRLTQIADERSLTLRVLVRPVLADVFNIAKLGKVIPIEVCKPLPD